MLDQAKAAGFQVVTDATDISKARMSVNPTKPVLGLFSPGNMDLEHAPLVPTAVSTAATRCTPNTARTAGQPHLPDMARAAIDLLDSQARGKKSLDHQRSHPATLVVVTADHGHTSQIVAANSTTTGVTATVTTADGAPMTVSYATTPYPGSQQHTGTEVRIAAKGPQAATSWGSPTRPTCSAPWAAPSGSTDTESTAHRTPSSPQDEAPAPARRVRGSPPFDRPAGRSADVHLSPLEIRGRSALTRPVVTINAPVHVPPG